MSLVVEQLVVWGITHNLLIGSNLAIVRTTMLSVSLDINFLFFLLVCEINDEKPKCTKQPIYCSTWIK